MSSDNGLFVAIFIIIAVILIIPILMMVFMIPLFGTWGMGHAGDGAMWGGTAAPWIWGLIWLVILVGGGYLLYRGFFRTAGTSTDDAIEELRMAFARGELSEEEFDQRRGKLEQDR